MVSSWAPCLPACGETGPSCFRLLPGVSAADAWSFPSTATADENRRTEIGTAPGARAERCLQISAAPCLRDDRGDRAWHAPARLTCNGGTVPVAGRDIRAGTRDRAAWRWARGSQAAWVGKTRNNRAGYCYQPAAGAAGGTFKAPDARADNAHGKRVGSAGRDNYLQNCSLTNGRRPHATNEPKVNAGAGGLGPKS